MNTLFFDNHKHAFWTNSTNPPIKIFELNPHIAGDFPKVGAAISQQGSSICISYYIKPCDWLDFADFDEKNFNYQDYLWEQNCLECFFELNNSLGYLEMNIAPNGAFATYRFDEYRTPNTMPPMRDDKLFIYQVNDCNLKDWHTRHIDIKFNEYFMEFSKLNHICQITKINPTVILYKNGEPIYYANKHANPPDFHNKAYWTIFDNIHH